MQTWILGQMQELCSQELLCQTVLSWPVMLSLVQDPARG